ncbi:hypothetical protein AB0L59_30250 [Streptomyces sp. NPDC052109]|uniref:hypothetical protein n=1 Tax=Streptomyces sp. NPDC052109 TaxID=3155527 RepID=UPI0034211952
MNEPRPAPSRGETLDAVALWASARVTELLGEDETPTPAYGSPKWQQLPGADPHKAAAMITAAELWRRHGHDDMSVIEAADLWRKYCSDELLTWFREASATHAPLASRKTIAELDALAKPKPAHPVQATAGWPPVAIPGRPGWYRHLVNGRQVDVQRAEAAA